MKAAIGSVLDVAGAFEFVRIDEAVRSAEFQRDACGVLFFAFGQAGADGGHADRALAEFGMGDGEHERAIDAA